MLSLTQLATMGFRPLDKEEWMGFAGAEPGTLIAYGEGEVTYLLCGDVLSVIYEKSGEEGYFGQTDYTFSAEAEEIC